MNLPIGKTLEQGLKLSEIDYSKVLKNLYSEVFTGYIVLTVEGTKGIEESLLLFEKGILKGAIFEEIANEKEFFGEEALHNAMNAFASSEGIIDVSSLSKQQAELILAFQEKMILKRNYTIEDLKKMVPEKYEKKKEKKAEESKIDIFKRLGLAGIEK